MLFGLDEKTENYNQRVNDLVKEWLADKKYVAKKLISYWIRQHKGCVIVMDNTDQFPHNLQDFCFTTAQEIAENLGCLVIVSMREERFHASRMHGTLDAYQNCGFHISSTPHITAPNTSYYSQLSSATENPEHPQISQLLHTLFHKLLISPHSVGTNLNPIACRKLGKQNAINEIGSQKLLGVSHWCLHIS